MNEHVNDGGASAPARGMTVVKFLKKLIVIALGAFIYAVGTAFFISPHKLAPGGVSGISVILHFAFLKLADIPVGVFVLILNIPLLIIGLIKFGKEFLLGTVVGTILLSIFITLLETLRASLLEKGQTWFVVDNPIIAGLAGGALMAIGLGIVFKVGATTGGTDIVVKLLRLKYKYVKMGVIFMATDVIIALSSLPVVNWKIQTVLYSFVAIITCSIVLDLVLYGTDSARLVYIVSDNSARIAERILSELQVGATFLDGVGAYTNEKKEVLMCVVKKHLFPKLKDIVRDEDSRAFLIVSSANEIFGEGFKDHFKDEF